MHSRLIRLVAVLGAVAALIALGTGRASAQDDEAAAVQENITKFFENLGAIGSTEGDELDALIEETVGLLEGGTEETGAQLQGLGSLAAGLTIEFQSVTIIDDTNAEYVFDLLIDGNPSQVTDATGKAVKVDGTWKLSQETWAALAALAADPEEGDGGEEGGGEEGGGEEEAADTGGEEELANTGANTDVLVISGVALLAAGAMTVAAVRRSRYSL